MSKRRLSEKQYAAIALLTDPAAKDLLLKDIAKRVGVSESTLRRWRTEDDAFINEVIAQSRRNAVVDLPRVMQAVPDIIINSENAAMLRTWLQAIGALTERIEVDNKGGSTDDVDDIRAEIERMRRRDAGE